MASATMTYGKKRSIFKTLGSRRQRHMTRSLAVKKHEPCMDTYPDTGRQSHSKVDFESNDIEALADALLDVPSPDAPGKGDFRSPTLVAATPRSYPESPAASANADAHEYHSPPYPPSIKLSVASTTPLWDSWEPGKNPSNAKAGAPRRAATTRHHAEPPRKWSSCSLGRSNSQHVGSRDCQEGLKASLSMPLPSMSNNASQSPVNKKTATADPDLMAVDEINDKVCAMLAATDALKPPAAQPTPSPSRISRISPSRVLSKMTCAWDRLHARHAEASSGGHREMDTPPVLDEIDPLTFSDIAFESSSAVAGESVTTIEIRLNEGGNLNKKKVQKIVGSQIARKPVADDGKSLRSGKSIESPLFDLGRPPTLTTLDSGLALTTDEPVPPVPRSPFDSEKAFESDLEDGILSSTPLGSSTPRFGTHKPSNATSSGSKGFEIMQEHVGSQDSQLEPERKHVNSLHLRGSTVPEPGLKIVIPARKYRCCSDIEVGLQRRSCGEKREKKHPSPSKGALEDLEVAFKRYGELHKSGADQDELDELARSFAPRSTFLAPLDKNQLMRSRIPVSGSKGPGAPRPQTQRAKEKAPEVRRAVPYRPPVPQADEEDELQQHPTCVQIGIGDI